ncbi:hypothetical protein CSUB01_11092 [Colletotrichum sublineola]|uniref:WD domain-containing protein n=1 Tax=Colletotrichum sublineola TaxID=1173701 RepID=A0A066XN80_COLSU|nr:hypothetical protein CSUB01_11092 [Colletotrichum sublineola]
MSSATISRGVCLILLWVLLQVELVSASTIPASGDQNYILHSSVQATSKRAPAQFRTFSPKYRGRIEKGTYLKSLFPLNDKDAERQNDGNAVASPWQDPKALARWGWTTSIKWAPFPTTSSVKFDVDLPSFRNALDNAFADPNHFVDPSKNALCVSKHSQSFLLKDGSKGQPTDAIYKDVHNPSSGAIIFDSNHSPDFMKARYRRGDIPELKHTSDLVYFQWLEACKEKNVHPSNIKTIFRAHISYAPTFTIVQQALWDAGKAKIPPWNERLTFSMDTRQGLAILGSSHGSGPALFLIQHKATLGLKKIKDVTVWGYRRDPNARDDTVNTILFLRFTVVDA